MPLALAPCPRLAHTESGRRRPWLLPVPEESRMINTGDKPLVFTVVKFTAKGVKVPERPDSRKDEL